MRFKKEDYERAIKNLTDAMTQLELHSDGNRNACHCCGDSGHVAWECGHNPLVAQVTCKAIAKRAFHIHEMVHVVDDADIEQQLAIGKASPAHDELWVELHEFLHYLGGHDFYMGCQLGPANVRGPDITDDAQG